ncbi:hypothetical protein IJ135_00200 [Candidatus Saccharibacteria bacterium]|nr:hypothetical protein [Candidatus Saccharibacteria bacterium]
MIKHKIVCAFSVASLMCGASGLIPTAVYAETGADAINSEIAESTEEITISLPDDILGNIVVPAGKTVNLNLSGHNITGTSGSTITNGGTLTISGEGNVVSVAAYAVDNQGTLSIAGGNYSTTVPVNYVNGTLTGSAPSLIRNGWDGPTTDDTAYLTISGGTFTGGLNNVKNDEHGVLTITGGSFTNNDGQNVILNGGKSLTITGGTFAAPLDQYHFGVQNQRMGADINKTVSVSDVSLPSFGFSKDEDKTNPSTYAAELTNVTVESFPLNTPMTTNCTAINLTNVVSGKGITFSTNCPVTVKNSQFGGGMSFTAKNSSTEASGTVSDTTVAGNFKSVRVPVTATNVTNGILTKSDGTEYRSGYNSISGAKMVVNGGTWGYSTNAKKIVFSVNNAGELEIGGGAVLDGGSIDVGTSGGILIVNDARIDAGINISTKFGGEVTINGGTIRGTLAKYATLADGKTAEYVINGGTFEELADFSYLADGKAFYKNADNLYEVLPAVDFSGIEQILVAKGGTAMISLPSSISESAAYEKGFITLPAKLGDEYASVDEEGVITGVKAGDTTLTIMTTQVESVDEEGTIKYVTYEIPVKVFDTESEEEKYYLELEASESLKEEDLEDATAATSLKSEIAEEEQLAGFYEVNVRVKDDSGNEVAELEDLGKLVPVKLTLSDDVAEVAEGYTRKYYVLRFHNGTIARLEATDNGDGTISFYNDLFSTFAVIYVDTANPVAPATDPADPTDSTDTAGETAAAQTTAGAPDTGALNKFFPEANTDTAGLVVTVTLLTLAAVAIEVAVWKKKHYRR